MSKPEGLGDVLRHAFRGAKRHTSPHPPVAHRVIPARPPPPHTPTTNIMPKTLAEALDSSVKDVELRALIERSSKKFLSSERRVITQSQNIAEPKKNVHLVSPAPSPDGLPKVIALRKKSCDHLKVDGTFVSFQLRSVGWLSKINPHEVMRRGYTRRVCREAVALLMSKWPGQIEKDDCALFFGFADACMKQNKITESVEIVRSQPDAIEFVCPE